MPALPPPLYEELLQLCEPLFRLPDERDGLLLPVLSTWPGLGGVRWEGSPRSFTARLIYQLPGAELKRTLESLGSAVGDTGQIAALCRRVDDALALTISAGGPLHAYYRQSVERLSAPQFQLDRRFVRLTLLLDQGPDAQGLRFVTEAQRPKYDSLATLLADVRERAVVLLGRPGCGKTTLLRRLWLERAWSELEAAAAAGPTPAAVGPVPFFVPLGSHRAADPNAPPPEPAEWLAAEWQRDHPDLPAFPTLFQEGRLLLLLDGLNELPHRDPDDYWARVGQWREFLPRAVAQGNTVVFSCRSLDYSAPLGSEAAPVRQVQIEPLSPERIEEFLTLHLAERGAAAWVELRADEDQLSLLSTPFFLRLLVDHVAATGETPAGPVALLTGFVRRALQHELIDHDHRLFRPGALLSADDIGQVNRWAWAGPYDLPAGGALIPALAGLAFRLQESETGHVRVPETQALAALAEAPGAPPADVIAAGVHLNLLDKDLARREILFYHQLFQEYFAARAQAATPQPGRLAVPWHVDEVRPSLAEVRAALPVSEPLPGLPATGWEETAVFAAALSDDPARFIRDLMPANLPLAARCAAAPETAVPPALVAELQAALLARVADPQADLRARSDTAEALGELGDPRFERRAGPHGDYLRPPLTAIPAGTYTVGLDDEALYDDEKPAHPVSIAAFEIGLFPVTNAEYRLFIQAGGYEDEGWWDTAAARAWLREGGGEGQKAYYRDLTNQLQDISDERLRTFPNLTPEQVDWYLWFKHLEETEREAQLQKWFPAGVLYRQPGYWDDSRFNHPSRPVVGLSWFEARAYCAWLSAQTGDAYGLPSEDEWEAAARGAEGRAFPYGPAFDVEAGNTFESHIRRTTPVGVFPGGRTPEGVFDLSGNVWEWTTTIFALYDEDIGDREAAENAEARRVVRGGSRSSYQIDARAAYRYHNHPDNRDNNIGCRVVRRPTSHPL